MSNSSNDLLDADAGYPPGWTPAVPPATGRRWPGSRLGWVLGVAAVVAVALVATIVVNARTSDSGSAAVAPVSPKSSATQRNTAPVSAGDTGSVAVITADATCGDWGDIRGPVVAAQNNGWARRDASQPRQRWDPARRSQFDAMGAALRTAADQTAILARLTPHRAMRELYGTFMSYGREYAAALPSYQPANDFLAQTALAAFDALTNVCAAADGSSWAILRAQVVPQVAAPSASTPVGNIDTPARFLVQPAPTCEQWITGDTTVQAQTRAWTSVDPTIERDQWTPDQRSTVERTAQVVTGQADDMEAWGRAAGNPAFEDLAVLGAQYFRAYGLGVPSYRPGDNSFAHVGFDISGLIAAACQVARA